jgi:hypothetical protein
MIEKAKYISEYKIEVTFKDGLVKLIDLKPFLSQSKHHLVKKFLDIELFKKFRIEHGALAWGDNEFDISPISIYRGDFDAKPVKLKKSKNQKTTV